MSPSKPITKLATNTDEMIKLDKLTNFDRQNLEKYQIVLSQSKLHEMEAEEFKHRKNHTQLFSNRPGRFTAKAHDGPRGRSNDAASNTARSGASQGKSLGNTTDRI